MQANADNQEPESSDDFAIQLTPPKTTTTRSDFANLLNVRIGLTVYGIVLPVVCHFITAGGVPFSAEWQSGELIDKLSFVLSGQCGWPVFLLLVFNMFCMGKVIFDEAEAFSKAWVRLGIFSGVLICGWYLFAFSFTQLKSPYSSFGLLLGAALWLLVVHGGIRGLQLLTAKYEPASFASVIIFGMIILFAVAVILTQGGAFFLPIALALYLATPLAFLTYLGVSIRILVLHAPARRVTLSQLMAWVTWCSAFAMALQKTIALSFAKYSELPLQPPEDCYVATAASKGYPSIVGSQRLPAATGQQVIVNQQLATFKAAELMLRTVSPKTHRAVRQFYDWLGPIAAAKLRGSRSATVAYLCLKPAEWLCRIVLRILLGHRTYQLTKKLYLARAKVTGFARVLDS